MAIASETRVRARVPFRSGARPRIRRYARLTRAPIDSIGLAPPLCRQVGDFRENPFGGKLGGGDDFVGVEQGEGLRRSGAGLTRGAAEIVVRRIEDLEEWETEGFVARKCRCCGARGRANLSFGVQPFAPSKSSFGIGGYTPGPPIFAIQLSADREQAVANYFTLQTEPIHSPIEAVFRIDFRG